MNGLVSSVPAVRVEGVVKRFGATVALGGAGLEIPGGTVFGLLGPNGAGKTTLVRILATLLTPDAGRAEVLGHDVVREPAAVRELLGLTGQFAAVDEILTGRENLEMFGRPGPTPAGCSAGSTSPRDQPVHPARHCRDHLLLDRLGAAHHAAAAGRAADEPVRHRGDPHDGGLRQP